MLNEEKFCHLRPSFGLAFSLLNEIRMLLLTHLAVSSHKLYLLACVAVSFSSVVRAMLSDSRTNDRGSFAM